MHVRSRTPEPRGPHGALIGRRQLLVWGVGVLGGAVVMPGPLPAWLAAAQRQRPLRPLPAETVWRQPAGTQPGLGQQGQLPGQMAGARRQWPLQFQLAGAVRAAARADGISAAPRAQPQPL